MNKNISVFIIFLVAFIFFIYLNPSYTGFVVGYTETQPEIELNLEETVYSKEDEFKGNITIYFEGPIKEDTTLTIKTHNITIEENITAILYDLNIPYQETGESYETSEDSQETQVLEFDQAGYKDLALKIEKDSTVDSLSFNILGEKIDDSYPKFPSIDFLNDNKNEFYFIGDPTGLSDIIFATELDTEGRSIPLEMLSNRYYCEIIDLPLTKELTIEAKYSKLNSGTIGAAILSYSPEGGKFYAEDILGSCVLPTDPTEEWPECEQKITLGDSIEDKYFVCVYTESDEDYTLLTESSSPRAAHICDKDDVDSTYIERVYCGPSNDLFIGVRVTEYDGLLDKDTEIAFLNNLVTTEQKLLDELTDYLETCDDVDNMCIVPIKIATQEKGKLTLKDLNVRYLSGGTPYRIHDFFSFSKQENLIHDIGNEEKYNLTISLSYFDLLTPSEEDDYKFQVYINGEKDKVDYEVYEEVPPDEEEVPYLIDSTKEKINEILTDKNKVEIANILGIKLSSAITSLNSYKAKFDHIETLDLTTEERETRLDTLVKDIETFRKNLPRSIQIKNQILNFPGVSPSIIKEEFLPKGKSVQKIYKLQSQFTINSNAKHFKIRKYSGDVEEKTLITRTISPLVAGTVIEQIPKSAISSANLISSDTRFEVLETDPVIKFNIGEYSYIIPGNVITKVNEISTIVVPNVITDPELYKKVSCGDGTCHYPLEDKVTCPEDCTKKISWITVIILLVILVAGVWYINFYKGKYSLKKLKPKKKEVKLFKTKADEINLKRFIIKSLRHKIPKPRIKTILVAKDWTEKQIDYIFKQI